jgi:hypothetical protein
MPTHLSDPLVLGSVASGAIGAVLLVQARVQARLMRARVASGAGTIVTDPATGLYSPAAAWQCLRAEANRAARLARPLHVWVAAANDRADLDERGRALAFELAAGATGIRVGERHLCVVSCAGEDASPEAAASDLDWSQRTIAPDEHAASAALAFLSEATGA